MYRKQSCGYIAPRSRTRTRTTARTSTYNIARQAQHHPHVRHDQRVQHASHSQHHRSPPSQQGADPHCQICSYTQPYPAEQKLVFHKHFSSLRFRELTGVEGTDNSYLCPSCKCSHAAVPEDRIKLVMADSSLHKFFALYSRSGSQYVGDMMHIDYITIPEGCVEDLVHAFRLDYELSEHHRPLDVVVSAGYNDLLMNKSRTFIMEGFRHLSDIVLNLGKDVPPGRKNTFAVASLSGFLIMGLSPATTVTIWKK